MGLDAVEIVLATEEAFGIGIEDAEAERILTPRQLIDLVMMKTQVVRSDVCLTLRSFNLVRRFLLAHTTLVRRDIHPETRLAFALPREHRATALRKLSTKLGVAALPDLVRARSLTTILMAVALLAGIIVALGVGDASAMLLGPGAVGVAAYFGWRMTKGQRTEFPKNLCSVGDLAIWITAHKPNLADSIECCWTREQVAARVKQIVTEILGTEAGYHEDARFIEDLGAG